MTLRQYHTNMAIILSAKKLQSILKKENESLLVFAHNNSGAVRVVGMTEYLKEGRNTSKGIRGKA
jgi:hypothetical protein